MSYTKHNYKKGDELLASQLNEMDDQIALNEQTADTLVTVSNTQPSQEKNRVWVKSTPSEVEIPTMDDLDEVSRQLSDVESSFGEVITGGMVSTSFLDATEKKSPSTSASTISYGQDGTATITSNSVNCFWGWEFDTEIGKTYAIEILVDGEFTECFVTNGGASSTHITDLLYANGKHTGNFTATAKKTTVWCYVAWNVTTRTISSFVMSTTYPRKVKNTALDTAESLNNGDNRPVTSDACFDAISDIAQKKNIVPHGLVLAHGWIDSTGAFTAKGDSETGSWVSTEFIPVIGGENISISVFDKYRNARTGLVVQVLAFYADDKSCITPVLGNYTAAATTVQTDEHRYNTTPVNAKYIRIGFYDSAATYSDDLFTFVQVEYNTTWTDYAVPQAWILKENKSHWYGKNWVAIGDSITARPGNYVATVAKTLGLNYTNAGISGAGARTMRESISDPTSPDYHSDWHTAVENADLVTIYGCINNFGVNAQPIGDLYNTQANTFIYQFKQLIDSIFTINDKCRLVIIGTHNAWDDGSGFLPDIYEPCNGTDTVGEYVEAVGKVARYYGCPFIDMYHLSGFNAYNGYIYLADCLHPNAKGYERISKILINEINNVQD